MVRSLCFSDIQYVIHFLARAVSSRNMEVRSFWALLVPYSCTLTLVGADDLLSSPALFLQVNKYYDLVNSFYEYGWGESYHFANR